MSTINEVIAAVSKTITAGSKWKCTENFDKPNPPVVLLYPDDIGEDESYFNAMARGVVTIPIVACVMVASVNNVAQTRRLYDAISGSGATSIVQAIFQNPTLGTDPNEATGGVATMTAHVARVDEIGTANTFDGVRVVQAKVRIHVKCRGDR